MNRFLPAAVFLLLGASASAQISPKPADGILPVVGSTRGLSSSNFKTELQLSNGSDARMTGWLVLHPHEIVARYDLEPRTTVAWADFVGSLDADGLGSLDLLIDTGRLPTVVARAYDDQPTGTNGVTVPLVPAAAVLSRNDSGVLLAPRDLERFRFNVGARALDTGAEIELVLRGADGVERHRETRTLEKNHFEQQRGDLFAGASLAPNDSLEVRILSGAAILYATTVDNQTNDSAIQVLRK
jgi:hypothetical protein